MLFTGENTGKLVRSSRGLTRGIFIIRRSAGEFDIAMYVHRHQDANATIIVIIAEPP